MKITPEEAEAFRERVRKQREEMANWVVIPIDDAIEELEALIDGGHQDWTSCQMYGHGMKSAGRCMDCGEGDGEDTS